MKTFMANEGNIEQKWYLIDATDKPLGRLASEIAKILRGKNKPTFTPHVDAGDYVIVINAEKVKVTGKKMTDKIYRHHSAYMTGLKEIPYNLMLEKNPERILYLAVQGMLPKNSLGREMMTKLRIFKGSEHDHQAQKPEVLDIKF